jgi:hypothetical protein
MWAKPNGNNWMGYVVKTQFRIAASGRSQGQLDLYPDLTQELSFFCTAYRCSEIQNGYKCNKRRVCFSVWSSSSSRQVSRHQRGLRPYVCSANWYLARVYPCFPVLWRLPLAIDPSFVQEFLANNCGIQRTHSCKINSDSKKSLICESWTKEKFPINLHWNSASSAWRLVLYKCIDRRHIQ